MFDEDLGARHGFGRGRDVRKLIKRQEANLEIIGNLRRGVAKEKGTRGRPAVSYYLTQQQMRWVVIKSEAPEADDLLRQILAVFKAWEDRRLVAREEAAQGPAASGAKTPTSGRQWPGRYSIEHSRFLTAGAPASILSGFLESVRKDNCFSRIATTLDPTITVTEDQVRIFDVDLGYAIGGQCTNKVRPRVRELQSRLRLMGPDPWYQIEAYQHLGHEYKLASVFLMNHEQAKAIATVLDPGGLTDIHYRLDLLYWHVALGRLSEIIYDPTGLMIATALDARAKRHGASRHLAPPLRARPVEPPPQSDPFAMLMVEQAAAKAVDPLVQESPRSRCSAARCPTTRQCYRWLIPIAGLIAAHPGGFVEKVD